MVNEIIPFGKYKGGIAVATSTKATVDHPAQARHAAGGAADYIDRVPSRFSSRDNRPRRARGRGPTGEAPITVIIGGRALPDADR